MRPADEAIGIARWNCNVRSGSSIKHSRNTTSRHVSNLRSSFRAMPWARRCPRKRGSPSRPWTKSSELLSQSARCQNQRSIKSRMGNRMHLEMANFPVREIRLCDFYRYQSGRLELNGNDLANLVLQDSRITEASFEIVMPG